MPVAPPVPSMWPRALTFNSPIAQAAVSTVLLLVVSAIWLVRRTRKAWAPSESFFGLVAPVVTRPVRLRAIPNTSRRF
ncbi:flagellar biogenesis protein FliO [Pseudonocardia eucalypti]|nr:flagellar biogenesis protein FliO [Pseudonocardia eucalypti]